MKPQEQRDRFIVMRAEGKSYSTIAKELGISKSTCTDWEKKLQEQIAERKAEQLEQLYSSYFMTREARIKKLGDTLGTIDGALASADFSQMPPDKLLDFKLKYTQALKEEYIATGRSKSLPEEINPAALMDMLKDLLERVRAGEVDTAQANRESMIISNLLKAYEQTELQAKIDALEAIIGGRA